MPMKRIGLACLLALLGHAALADERQDCAAAQGSYLTGTVVQGPKFTHGQFRSGVELSHTHLKVHANEDGRVYDVAIDNAFASGYQANQRGVPAALAAIREGDRLALCGALYDRGVGIHFVHTNCGARPTAAHPDGWVKVVDGRGRAGANLEGSTNYCSLFESGSRRHGR